MHANVDTILYNLFILMASKAKEFQGHYLKSGYLHICPVYFLYFNFI